MRKSFKFKLYRNSKKAKKLSDDLFVFSRIYNHTIALCKTYYKLYKKHPHKYDLINHIVKLKKSGRYDEWKTLGFSQAVQEVVERIDKSYGDFFKWCKTKKGGSRKSPPSFKPFRKYKSFTLKQHSWGVDEENKRIFLFLINNIKHIQII